MTSPLPYFTDGVRLVVECAGTRSVNPRQYPNRSRACPDAAVATHAGKHLCFAHLARAGGSVPICGAGCLCALCLRWARLDRGAAVVR